MQPKYETERTEIGEQLLDKRGIANFLGVSVRTIDQWMADRRLSYFKIGRTVRFRVADVLEHLKNFKVN